MKQTPLFEDNKSKYRSGSLVEKLDKNKIYGGDIKYRKIARPLEPKKPIHIVFRINKLLSLSLRKHISFINAKLLNNSKSFQIKIHNHSVNTNHIHLIVSTTDTKNIGRFLRVFSAQLVFYFRKKGLKLKLWESRPFSKVAHWGKHYKILQKYIIKNFKEVVGFCVYSPRNHQYKYLEPWGYG